MKKGILYVVATPIGNLEDITYRAINILKSVDIIAAEDTRHTLKLLNHYEISKHLISYHRHNEEIKVVPVPGACAFVNALISSGLSTDTFLFLGFLPLNKKNRKQKLEQIKESTQTTIIYEAPHKLQSTLKDLEEFVSDRNVVLARELTKIHEEFIRGNIKEIIEKSKDVKGEMIILIEGKSEVTLEEKQQEFKNMSLEEHFSFYEKQGFDKKDIIKKIAKDRGVPKNEIYMYFMN